MGTEWAVNDSGVTTSLNNDTTIADVTLSGINGSLLVESPLSFLQFGTSQLRCSYASPDDGDFSLIATLTQAGKSCLLSRVLCIALCDRHVRA